MANLQKEIWVSAENKPGTLARVAGCVKEAGVSITGVCAWGEGGKSNFCLLTDNNSKALSALQKAGHNAREQDVVCCTLQNRAGTLAECCQKLGQAGINIERCYVTASGSNALLCLVTNDNQKASQLI